MSAEVRTLIHDVLADSLVLLDGKQDTIDQLVVMMDDGIPLADDLRALLTQQSRETKDLIARVQEAFLP